MASHCTLSLGCLLCPLPVRLHGGGGGSSRSGGSISDPGYGMVCVCVVVYVCRVCVCMLGAVWCVCAVCLCVCCGGSVWWVGGWVCARVCGVYCVCVSVRRAQGWSGGHASPWPRQGAFPARRPPTPSLPERRIPGRSAQLPRMAPLAAELQIRSWTDLSSPGLAGSPAGELFEALGGEQDVTRFQVFCWYR